MSTCILIILIALASLSYPLAGAASVAVKVLDGKRSKGAGFSFLPELIVLPAAFFGAAWLIDYFATPWGRRIVGGLCVLMFAANAYAFFRACRRIRSAKNTAG